jgi:molecular chaperone GrpE
LVLKANKKEKAAPKKDTPEKKKTTAEEPEKAINGKETKTADKADAVVDELTGLKEELALEKDKTLRLSAEFENFKKRKQREIDDFKKFANESVFRQFLSVVDNLERAISSAEDNKDDAGLLEGVRLTHKEILKLFEAFNVKPVEAENQPFDPNFHQAVTQEEKEDTPDNTVTTVLQKGYLLHDRLIRPAMVVVSKRVEKEPEKTQKN